MGLTFEIPTHFERVSSQKPKSGSLIFFFDDDDDRYCNSPLFSRLKYFVNISTDSQSSVVLGRFNILYNNDNDDDDNDDDDDDNNDNDSNNDSNNDNNNDNNDNDSNNDNDNDNNNNNNNDNNNNNNNNTNNDDETCQPPAFPIKGLSVLSHKCHFFLPDTCICHDDDLRVSL